MACVVAGVIAVTTTLNPNRDRGIGPLTGYDFFPTLLPLPPHGAASDGSGGVGGARFAGTGGDPLSTPRDATPPAPVFLRAEAS
jgi:hypothetical protein